MTWRFVRSGCRLLPGPGYKQPVQGAVSVNRKPLSDSGGCQAVCGPERAGCPYSSRMWLSHTWFSFYHYYHHHHHQQFLYPEGISFLPIYCLFYQFISLFFTVLAVMMHLAAEYLNRGLSWDLNRIFFPCTCVSKWHTNFGPQYSIILLF